MRVHAFLEASRATLYLDTSGEPLFKRGWRTGAAEAPLRENLAAGIVMLAGWQPEEPLLDPMCGGGTLLVEAAAQLAGTVAQSDPRMPPLSGVKLTALRRVKILGTARRGEVIQVEAPLRSAARVRLLMSHQASVTA